MNVKKATISILAGAFWCCGGGEWITPRFFDIWGLPKCGKLKFSDEESRRIIKTADDIYRKLS